MAQEQIRQFIDQATQSIQSGQFDQALQLIEQALALDPSSADAYILKGIGLSQTGQPAAATEALRRAIELDPTSAKAHYNLAVHLYSQAQKPDALVAAQKAAELDPGHATARQLISTIETELGVGVRPETSYAHDPLAVPPVTATPPENAAPPVVEQPAPRPFHQAVPPGSGVAGEGQYVNPYMKDPYATQEHSIPFIGNMGGAWTAIGWLLAVLSLVGGLTLIYVVVQVMPLVNGNNQEEVQRIVQQKYGGLGTVIQICGLGSVIGIVAWTIIDVLDRRTNPVWIIPSVVCTCCGFGWLTLPIYILAGRNK